MMIGIFRANPEAFQGNINVMRAGAILRVPSADELCDRSARPRRPPRSAARLPTGVRAAVAQKAGACGW